MQTRWPSNPPGQSSLDAESEFSPFSCFCVFVVSASPERFLICFSPCSQVKVLYGGTELFDDEVRHTFYNDMMLAVFSGACITLLVYILTSFSGAVWPV